MNGSGGAGKSRRAASRSPPCTSGAEKSRGTMAVALTLLALLIELTVGYPDRLLRAIGHPVAWMGRLLGMMDAALNRESVGETARRSLGAAAIVVLIGVVGVIAAGVQGALLLLPFGIVIVALVASTLLAQRSLYAHVARVAAALERGGLAARRVGVSHLLRPAPA